MSSILSSEQPEQEAVELLDLQQINQLIHKHQFVEALTALTQLVARDMNNSRLWLMIGLAYTRMGHWKPAIGALETAVQLNPREEQARMLLALAFFSIGRQTEACELIDKVVKQSNVGQQWMMRSYLHSHTSRDPMTALAVARDWGRRFADPLTRQARPLPLRDRSPRKKLKIGYVTADFREHSVAFFMLPVLLHHNHDNVEVHVYCNGPWDHFTPQLRALVPHWEDVMELSDEALNSRIRADGIDVLVDLSGFTHGHRLGVFARRAAPVQATWLGYLQTLGMKAMDYRLVAPDVVPDSHAPFYSEKLFQLGYSASYAPPAYAPLCEQPPMLRNGYPTLISLNNSAKITDEMLAVWARILELRQDARLIIMVKELDADAAQQDMQPRVEAAGMPLERVSVLHQQPLNQFMELGHIADIMLDTHPISAGTTALHGLWMGLPIVTIDAVRGVDASCARVLQVVGGAGEVVQDAEAYVQAVLSLMDDPQRLQEQRATIRERMRQCGYMDYPARTAELEKAFRLMWLNWLRGDHKTLSVQADLQALMEELEQE